VVNLAISSSLMAMLNLCVMFGCTEGVCARALCSVISAVLRGGLLFGYGCPSKKLLRLSQQKLRLATGILIGHPQLNPHLKRNGYN